MLTAALNRSSDLILAAQRTCEKARCTRLASRGHQLFVRLEGEVNGQAVRAVVRTDSSISADARLLEQAQLVAALEDTFDDGHDGHIVASLHNGPLTSALTLTRACDRVTTMEMTVLSSPPAGRRRAAQTPLPDSRDEA
jgi:hypothetical protein